MRKQENTIFCAICSWFAVQRSLPHLQGTRSTLTQTAEKGKKVGFPFFLAFSLIGVRSSGGPDRKIGAWSFRSPKRELFDDP